MDRFVLLPLYFLKGLDGGGKIWNGQEKIWKGGGKKRGKYGWVIICDGEGKYRNERKYACRKRKKKVMEEWETWR